MTVSRFLLLSILCVIPLAPAVALGLPPDAEEIIKGYEAQLTAIQAKAEKDVEAVQKKAEADLQAALEKCRQKLLEAQDAYTKAAKLDEALAIRDRIAALKSSPRGEVMKDPGNLSGYGGEVGRVLYIETTGTINSSIYGSDWYSADSNLSTAAVHAGVLKNGQTGIVKVTILEPAASFPAAGKNGVVSREWYSKLGAYKVEPSHVAGKTEAKPTEAAKKKDVITNPGNLASFVEKLDAVILVEVTGSATGNLWGSGPYTSDSSLATAAVHAGALKDGEKGVVMVKMLLPQTSYPGSSKNGVTSSTWNSPWYGCFTVERAK